MKKLAVIAAGLAILATPALAQQQQPAMDASDVALSLTQGVAALAQAIKQRDIMIMQLRTENETLKKAQPQASSPPVPIPPAPKADATPTTAEPK